MQGPTPFCWCQRGRVPKIGGIFTTTTMKTLSLLLLALCTGLSIRPVKGQNKPASLSVPFIEQTPVVDGRLDPALKALPPHTFPVFYQLDNPLTDTARLTYRMAYTPTHLYVYIETNVDSISYHLRGHLWGDGYKLLLAMPQKGASTSNQYYDLVFSPSQDSTYWMRQVIAAYNFKQTYQKLGPGTQSAEQAYNGRSGFEALIAWQELPPYHPWQMPTMGYNLYFAKGINKGQQGYWPNGYAVVADEGIWDEELPQRHYALLQFEAPTKASQPLLQINALHRNLRAGQKLPLQVSGLAPNNQKYNLSVQVKDSTGQPAWQQSFKIQLKQKLSTQTLHLLLGQLPTGNYTLVASYSSLGMAGSAYAGQLPQLAFSMLPSPDFKAMAQSLQNNARAASLGVVNTLMFKLQQLQQQYQALKPYEAAPKLVAAGQAFNQQYQLFKAGQDPYQGIIEPYRRAFLSAQDSTYQPYSIKLPQNYNPTKAYPLLVFLHGSGATDQGLLNAPRSNGQFIELAPYGRDMFRAYAEDDSQKDIIEAIEDVKKHFKINAEKVLIGGFSMGGYGCLRAFYEHPELYCGVAVFAGHPDLASAWLEEPHPNFRNPQYLKPFKGVPVFVYHGQADPALSIGAAQDLVNALQTAGALVTHSFVPNRGHVYQDAATNRLYHNWLEQLLK